MNTWITKAWKAMGQVLQNWISPYGYWWSEWTFGLKGLFYAIWLYDFMSSGDLQEYQCIKDWLCDKGVSKAEGSVQRLTIVQRRRVSEIVECNTITVAMEIRVGLAGNKRGTGAHEGWEKRHREEPQMTGGHPFHEIFIRKYTELFIISFRLYTV